VAYTWLFNDTRTKVGFLQMTEVGCNCNHALNPMKRKVITVIIILIEGVMLFWSKIGVALS